MIKSGFRQLHFSNGNISIIRHRKAAKKSTLFKNNKMVFLYPFFPHTTIILFQVVKKLEKRNGGNGSLLLFCVLSPGGSYRKRKLIIKKMAIYKTALRVNLIFLLDLVWNLTIFLHIKVQYKGYFGNLISISKIC